MAGFYNLPFPSVAPKAAETTSDAAPTITDSFIDVARCIRLRIYAFMNATPESREVLQTDESKKLDQLVDDYLKYYKNMTRNNVSRTETALIHIAFHFSDQKEKKLTLLSFCIFIGPSKAEICSALQQTMLGSSAEGGEKRAKS